MKRVLSLVLVLAMVLAMAPAVFADEATYAAATLIYDWDAGAYVEKDKYATFEEAYAAALDENAWDVEGVKLLSDVTLETVFIHSDYGILDLNGHSFTSDGFVAFSGSNVVDNSAVKTGRLVPGYGKLALSKTNTQMAMYGGMNENWDDTYMFVSPNMDQQLVNEWTSAKLDYMSLPRLGTTVVDGETKNIATYFSETGELETLIRMTWTTKNGAAVTQDYLFPAEMAVDIYTSQAFQLIATNLTKVSNVTVSTVVRSAATGFEVVSEAMTRAGTAENPIALENGGTITVPAGETLYLGFGDHYGKTMTLTKVGDADDSKVTLTLATQIDSTEYAPADAIVLNGNTLTITNAGTAAVTYTTTFSAAPGSSREDAAAMSVLEGRGMPIVNAGTGSGWEGYWSKWTATGSGTFTAEVIPGSMMGGTQCWWAMKIVNATTGVESEPLEYGTLDPNGYELTRLEVNVSEGDEIYVNILDANGESSYPVEFYAIFSENSMYNAAPVTTGINYAAIADAETSYYFAPYYAPAAGTVTVKVVNAVTAEGWGEDKTTAEGWWIDVVDMNDESKGGIVEDGAEILTFEVAKDEMIMITVAAETEGKVAFILQFEEAAAE